MVVRSAQGPHIMTHMTAVVVQMHSSPSPFIRHVGILVTHEVSLLGPPPLSVYLYTLTFKANCAKDTKYVCHEWEIGMYSMFVPNTCYIPHT